MLCYHENAGMCSGLNLCQQWSGRWPPVPMHLANMAAAVAVVCCSYCVSAKTGYSVEHMVHSICARLAGLAVPPPPLQQQHGALQQQPSTELQPTPEPSKARDWRIGWCSKLFCCGP